MCVMNYFEQRAVDEMSHTNRYCTVISMAKTSYIPLCSSLLQLGHGMPRKQNEFILIPVLFYQ